jgi:hypothetical protein
MATSSLNMLNDKNDYPFPSFIQQIAIRNSLSNMLGNQIEENECRITKEFHKQNNPTPHCPVVTNHSLSILGDRQQIRILETVSGNEVTGDLSSGKNANHSK